MIGFVIVHNDQIFRTSCGDGARTGDRDGSQTKVYSGASVDGDLHLLRIFVEGLRTADSITVCFEVVCPVGNATETVAAVVGGSRVLRATADCTGAETHLCISNRATGGSILDDSAHCRSTCRHAE